MSTTIYKSAEIEIEIDDVKEFIDNCNDTEVKEIIKYCKSDLQIESPPSRYKESGIPITSLQDEYKVRAIKEIWEDLSIEDIENFVQFFKNPTKK